MGGKELKSIVIYYSRAGYNYVNGENALEKSLPGELKKEIGNLYIMH